jgi:hypothetical protein
MAGVWTHQALVPTMRTPARSWLAWLVSPGAHRLASSSQLAGAASRIRRRSVAGVVGVAPVERPLRWPDVRRLGDSVGWSPRGDIRQDVAERFVARDQAAGVAEPSGKTVNGLLGS